MKTIRLKTNNLRQRNSLAPNWRADKRTAAQRGYGYLWQKYRERFLQEHPLCEICNASGKVTAASVVDHIKPHKGDRKLFWDTDNHQALCKHCHDSIKQRLEKSGTVAGCDETGMPIDPAHSWNRERNV